MRKDLKTEQVVPKCRAYLLMEPPCLSLWILSTFANAISNRFLKTEVLKNILHLRHRYNGKKYVRILQSGYYLVDRLRLAFCPTETISQDCTNTRADADIWAEISKSQSIKAWDRTDVVMWTFANNNHIWIRSENSIFYNPIKRQPYKVFIRERALQIEILNIGQATQKSKIVPMLLG